MGYAGKLDYKYKAQTLRKAGSSYKDILLVIPVSKNTVSRWCRDIPLTSAQQQVLSDKRGLGGIHGSLLGAKVQQAKRELHTKTCYEAGMKRVHGITKREKLLTGIALYAAEGTKADGRFEFTNADPKLIEFMSIWLRQFFTVDEKRLRGVLWIHDDNDVNEAILFWSHVAAISKEQFHKSYIVPNKNSAKIRKKKHNYGIFSLRYSDVTISRQIQGLIAGLFNAPWYNNRTLIPRSSTVEQDAVTRQRSGVIRDGKRGEFRET